MKGLPPMKGRRSDGSREPASRAGLGFLMTVEEKAFSFCVPGLVAGPAGMLVSVEDCPETPGRAVGVCFEPPVKRFNQSPIEDLGFIVCALAMSWVSLRAYFEEPLLSNERGQIKLHPSCTAGIHEDPTHPWGSVGRPWRGAELLGVAQSEHARDHEPRAAHQALGDEDHAPFHPRRYRVRALEGGEI